MRQLKDVAIGLVLGLGAGVPLGLWLHEDPPPAVGHAKAPVTDRTADPPLPALTIENPDRWWTDQGFVRLTPPIHLPTGGAERTRTEVWIKIPPKGVIRTRLLEAKGRHTLEFPAGTISDRVESWRPRGRDTQFRVADVRGVRLEPQGRQVFRVFRPSRPTADASLFGYEWPRDSVEKKQRVLAAMTAQMARGRGHAWRVAPDRRKSVIKGYRRRSGCARCHAYDRDEITRGKSDIAVNRGTDASGLFVPLYILRDDAPLEFYRPRDMNAADDCVSVACGDGEPGLLVEKPDGARRYRCEDGSVPRGRLDWVCARAAGDGHAEAVCASRKYLYDHLDALGRKAFSKAFDTCDIPAKSGEGSPGK